MSSDFIHHYQPGDKDKPVILALHGTGGDESDLVPLAMEIAPGSAILSPRGKILEGNMPRFFKRLAEGVFDQEDLAFRTQELSDWIIDACDKYGIDRTRLYALGYSNGANIAASILLRHSEVLAGAIMLRAMVPFEPTEKVDLSSKKILIATGVADPIADETQSKALQSIFNTMDASVTYAPILAGHNLIQKDVVTAKTWLEENA